jgi:amidase
MSQACRPPLEIRFGRTAGNTFLIGRLLGAGAVIFGKTNVPCMLADAQSYNEIYVDRRLPREPLV